MFARGIVFFLLLISSFPVRVHAVQHDPYIDTILGVCRLKKYPVGWLSVDVPGMESFRIRNARFRFSRFRVEAFFQKDPSGKKTSAPLMVVLPGIFTSAFDNAAAEMGERYWRLGFHVMVIPNPWTLAYSNASLGKMGDLHREAEEIYSLIQDFQNHLASERVLESTHMMGYSYGGFLTAMVNALDVRNQNRIDGGVVIAGPPLNIRQSLDRLDRLVDEVQYLDEEMTVFEQLRKYRYFCEKFEYASFDPRSSGGKSDILMAKMFVAIHGFQGSLGNVVSNYDSNHQVGHRPDSSLGFEAIDRWRASLRFQTWFELYAPEVFAAYRSEDFELSRWVGEVAQKDPDRILVVTAENDFINDPRGWGEFDFPLRTLQFGGHLGFRHEDVFHQYLTQAFQR